MGIPIATPSGHHASFGLLKLLWQACMTTMTCHSPYAAALRKALRCLCIWSSSSCSCRHVERSREDSTYRNMRLLPLDYPNISQIKLFKGPLILRNSHLAIIGHPGVGTSQSNDSSISACSSVKAFLCIAWGLGIIQGFMLVR